MKKIVLVDVLTNEHQLSRLEQFRAFPSLWFKLAVYAIAVIGLIYSCYSTIMGDTVYVFGIPNYISSSLSTAMIVYILGCDMNSSLRVEYPTAAGIHECNREAITKVET